MKTLKIAAVGLVASALVVGSIAGPASAATEQQVAGAINVAAPAISVPVFGAASLAFTTNEFDPRYGGDLDVSIVANGATYVRTYAADVDIAGNGSLDVMKSLSYAAFNYGDVPAGTYTITLTSAGEQYYNSDYSVKTIVAPAQSAPVTVTVTKLASSVTKWKAKTKSVKYKKLAKVTNPTVKNAGPSNTVVVQYRTSKKGKWKTIYNGEIPTYSSTSQTMKITFNSRGFNTVSKLPKKLKNTKFMKRGTWYFRLVVKDSPFVTGSVSNTIAIKVK